MKVFKAIVKIAVALAAAAGAVYVVATYGEEIVSRAKKLWSKLTSGCSCCCTMSAAFDPEEADTEETARRGDRDCRGERRGSRDCFRVCRPCRGSRSRR